MTVRRHVEAEITLRSTANGGRKYPDGILEGFQFRPGIVRGDRDQPEPIADSSGLHAEIRQGVAFLSGPHQIVSDKAFRATFAVIGWPSPYCDWIQPGETFTIREGPMIIGSGCVIRAWTEDAT